MLRLTRLEHESIDLYIPGFDETVRISITKIDRGKIHLGIVAPLEIKVLRSELERR
jgi:sRNA-binding carbon storage regulator CsrA